LQFTINDFDKFSNLNDRRLSANIFLYTEKLRSTSTEEIGAYLKYSRSSQEISSGKLSIVISSPSITFEILVSILKPRFFAITSSNFL